MSRPVVSDAAHFAVAVFNDGNDAFVKLFEQLGLSGGFTVKSAHSSDTTRLYHENQVIGIKLLERDFKPRKRAS